MRISGLKSLVAAALVNFGVSAPAQSGALAIETHPKPAAYEVVSVKPSQPGCAGMSISNPPGRYSARCVTLWALMYNAYKVRSFEGYPPGLPPWGDKDTFDVEAKAADDFTAAKVKPSLQNQGNLGREMLQSLLADRFQVRVHYESRVQPIYELVLAKSGFKLKPLPADQNGGGWSGRPGEMSVHNMNMAAFADSMSLANLTGRTVVDKTGLTGNYEIKLKWTPDDKQGTPDAGPTIFTAFEEQLGLKLKPAKGPVDTLVIDHAEKPSEN